jgi:hypothetical protein
MCVTTEVQGKFQLRGNSADRQAQLNQQYNAHHEQQWFPGQRRDVTYVSRLQCVQAAIHSQIEELVKERPNAKVALVTFNNEVTLIGDGSKDATVITGDKLNNYDQLLAIGNGYKVDKTIRESAKALEQKLFGLEETGSTALGPAAVVCVGLAQRYPGATIVLATDGLSNTGIGQLEVSGEEAVEKARSFYQKLGEYAQSKSATINVVRFAFTWITREKKGKFFYRKTSN